MKELIEGYCHKCKSRQEMTAVVEGMTRTGVPMKKGQCTTCGTTIVTIGPKPKVAKVKKEKAPKPVKVPKSRKKKVVDEDIEDIEDIVEDDE